MKVPTKPEKMEGNAAIESIDKLNAQLNSAVRTSFFYYKTCSQADPLQLVQIGRTFRDANGADSKLLGSTRGQEQRVDLISKANSKFHEVLDEMEIEIVSLSSTLLSRPLNYKQLYCSLRTYACLIPHAWAYTN